MIRFITYNDDCVNRMAWMKKNSVDAAIFSPPYPGIKREYGTWIPSEWMKWMRIVMRRLRRVVKDEGSAVVVIGPNFEKMGKMNTWPYEFALAIAKTWGIVQDVYWMKTRSLPNAHAIQHRLLRPSVEWCLWIGNPDCYRDQESVLWDYSQDHLNRISRRAHLNKFTTKTPSGNTVNYKRMSKLRGGSTPMNFLPCCPEGYENHPACFPEKLAEFWVKYICPKGGTVLDPFMGSGTTGVASIRHGRKFIGIESVKRYTVRAKDRIQDEVNKVSK